MKTIISLALVLGLFSLNSFAASNSDTAFAKLLGTQKLICTTPSVGSIILYQSANSIIVNTNAALINPTDAVVDNAIVSGVPGDYTETDAQNDMIYVLMGVNQKFTLVTTANTAALAHGATADFLVNVSQGGVNSSVVLAGTCLLQ